MWGMSRTLLRIRGVKCDDDVGSGSTSSFPQASSSKAARYRVTVSEHANRQGRGELAVGKAFRGCHLQARVELLGRTGD